MAWPHQWGLYHCYRLQSSSNHHRYLDREFMNYILLSDLYYWNLLEIALNLQLKTGGIFLVGSMITYLEAPIIINFLVTVLTMTLPRLSILINIHAFLSSSAAWDDSPFSPGLFPRQSQNLMSTMDAPGWWSLMVFTDFLGSVASNRTIWPLS